jgi:hypothetical protein
MAIVKLKDFGNGSVFPYYPECPFAEEDPYELIDRAESINCKHPNRPFPYGIRKCLSHHIVDPGKKDDCPFGK